MASTTAPPSSPPPAGAATASSSADDAIIQPGKAPGQTGNRIFTGLSFGAGTLIMVVLALLMGIANEHKNLRRRNADNDDLTESEE